MTEQDTNHKGGRPKAVKGKARTKTISTRLTLAEWKTVMKRIADAGKKPSHFLRELLLQGKVVAARTQEDRQQIRMLEGGCNNLNQLAKMAHQQGFPRTKEKITRPAGRVQQNHRGYMMGDLKKRASFAKLVNYVNNPKKARLIDSKDVRLDDNAQPLQASMQGQADDKPGRRLKNPVYHISLDFAHEDTPKLTDGLMAEIAREYMKRMGIVNTQYIVCRHTDREHQHLHIVANRVDNDGNTISDRNDAIRNVAVCKALTREYGLHFSKGKVNVKRDRLRGKDKVKYQIHDAVKAALPHCNSWSELCDRLAKQGIGVSFKFDRRNGNIVGVSFTKDGVSFSGSRIDRGMGFYRLDKQFGGRIAEGLEWRNNPYHPRPTAECGTSLTGTIYKPEQSI